MISRFGLPALSAGLLVALAAIVLGPAQATQAALVEGGKGPQLLVGIDDDNQGNTAVQAGAAANQALNNTDVVARGQGNDVMFGLLGNDVMDGGPGRDIILGGPDPGAPNSDIMFGGPDGDVNLWAPGDGSEAFIGGPGVDAIIFGSTDRPAGILIPTLKFGVAGFPQGIPTANVSELNNFCTVEPSPLPGYDYLVRFRGRAAQNIIVSVRLSEVEQVCCPGLTPGTIEYADLTDVSPAFVPVGLADVDDLNALVAEMIR